MTQFDDQLRAGFEQTLLVAGETRNFVTLSAAGSGLTTSIQCIWSVGQDMEEMVTLAPNGVYFKADVLLSLRAVDLPSRPRPFTSVIETPLGSKWQVVELNEDYGVYHIKLAKNVP